MDIVCNPSYQTKDFRASALQAGQTARPEAGLLHNFPWRKIPVLCAKENSFL